MICHCSGEASSNEFVASGCGVIVLACGGRLLEGAAIETPTLTWKRNEEELTSSSEDEVISFFFFCTPRQSTVDSVE